MAEPKRIPIVINDTGELGTVPENELQDNISRGAVRLAEPKEIHDYEIQKKYGDREIRTAVESAADMASLGLHSKAMQWLGLETQEEQQGQREANPTARTVGDIGGFVVPLLIPGGAAAAGAKAAVGAARAAKGASAVARLAEAGAATARVAGVVPRAVSAAGRLTTGAVTKALGGGAEKLAGRALAHGLGAATEGALMGAAQAVEEDVIGESELTAEKLASSIGYGALTGGLIGAGTTVAGAGLSAAGRAAKDAAKKLLGKTGKLDELAAMESWQSTLPNKRISKGLTQEQKIKYGRIALDENVTGAGKNVESIYQGAQSKLDEIGPQLGELNKQIDALNVAEIRSAGKGFAPKVGHVASRIEDEVLAPLSKSTFDQKTLRAVKGEVRDYLKQFDVVMDPKNERQAIANVFAKDGEMSLAQLHTDRVRLDANTKFDNTISQHVNDARKQIRGILSDEYKKAADKITDEFGENAGKQLREMNQRYEAFAHIKDAAEDTFSREQAKVSQFGLYDRIAGGAGTVLGAATMGLPGAALGYAAAKASQFAREKGRGYVATALDKLSRNQAMESMTHAVDWKIAKSLGSAIGTAGKTIGTAGRIGAEQMASNGAPADEFLKKAEQIRSLATDNQRLINTVQENTKHLAAAAPATTTMLGVVAQRATQFLNSKLPPEQIGPMGVEPPAMSKMEKSKFNKYQAAVANPMSLLEQIQNGNVQPETVEAVKNVYPKMYASIQQLSYLLIASQPKGKLNEKRKVSLSYALGIPLTRGMQPGFLANAKGYVSAADKQKAEGGQGGPGRKGSEGSHKRLIASTQTGAQRLAGK
jgi:hypothetical protein